MNIPEKRVQCGTCGRVRICGQWTHAENIADEVRQCPECIDKNHRAHERQRRRDALRVVQKFRRPHKVGEPDWEAITKGE